MMKPLCAEADYPTHFFVKGLKYLPRTIYHIVRHTLWPIKGHSSSTKLEGTMKTLVFYILNCICFNTHDFFIRQLVSLGIDLFGQKFYASTHNHVVFLPDVDMSHEAIYPQPAKEPLREDNAAYQSFSAPLEATRVPTAIATGPLVV